MNIAYNRLLGEKEFELFKLMEEFVYSHLKNKSMFYRITVDFREYKSKKYALTLIGGCTIGTNYLRPLIQISDEAIRLYSNSYIRCGEPQMKSYEQFRYYVIFHELAHMVRRLDDAELLKNMTPILENHIGEEEEDIVENAAKEFLIEKGILDRVEVMK